MPLIATRGAASAQGFGEFAQSGPAIYIEDVFSTYLYSGTGASQTITNNIDLSGEGGLVWGKMRNDSGNNFLQDTERGTTKSLTTNNTDGDITVSQYITAFNNNGFTLGTNLTVNGSTYTYCSWTFRKAKKFFDVVTYTGNGSAGLTVSHNLGSVPGCMIVKSTSLTENWAVYHRSNGNTKYMYLNTTAAAGTSSNFWNNTDPTSTTFTLGNDATVNDNGSTYVAYLFAHDAGGFGDAGSDNVVSCGSYTGDGTTDGSKLVSLGYEPQWVLVKRTDSSTNGGWHMIDVMRGMPTATSASSITALLLANTSAAENLDSVGGPKSTGFSPVASLTNTNGATYIYIAIRRGPMKTPESGTSVYNAITYTGNGTARTITGWNFPLDLVLGGRRPGSFSNKNIWFDRLRGSTKAIVSWDTAAEATESQTLTNFALMDGVGIGTDNNYNQVSTDVVLWGMRRAPGFFDVVCYTGTGTTAQNVTHNLGVAPELMIVKVRDEVRAWTVYSGNSGQYLLLNTTDAVTSNSNVWDNTAPSSTVFRVGNFGTTNSSGKQIVAYLFASVSGVSKVGSYTGTGTTLQVNCGFTGGARFVLIKRTDSTGDWYVWDSARGIVAGNDPYLLLNSIAAEVTNTDYVDTYSAGFEISSTAPAAINANGGTFIFLAIA
jgi:uncharacterized protein YxeA